MERAKLKERAKELLRGKYTPLILGVLVFIVAALFGNILDLVFNVNYLAMIFELVASVFLTMGFVNTVVKTARGEDVEVENMFQYAYLGLKYLVIALIVGLIIGFLILLLAIASKSLTTVLANVQNMNVLLYIFLVIMGGILTTAIIGFMLYLIISFSQVLFILNDEPEEKIGEILNKSFDMLDGYRVEYLILCLSFLGWLVLGIFTVGILYLWLIPYMMVTMALYYEKLKERYSYVVPLKEEVEEVKKEIPKKTTPKKTTAKKSTTKSKTKTKSSTTKAKNTTKTKKETKE